CIVHGHIIAEVLASEVDDSYVFPIVLEGPGGQSQEIDPKTGKPNGQPGCAYLVWDTGAFELLISGRDAQVLGLPNLGAITVGGVTGSSPAYRSRVTLIGVPGQEPVPVRLENVDCVVDPSAQQSLFGSRYAIMLGLGLIITGTTPAQPGVDATVQGQVKIALYQGEGYVAPKAP
nr:hypothetical protein [Thermaerobacter sp.]